MLKEIEIRFVTEEDAPELLRIYAPYVLKTAITFEYDVPSEEEFRSRIRNTLRFYPYIAAVENGAIIGYAYAGRFHAREAYQWCAETSIYVAEDQRGKGIGKMLYEALEYALQLMHIINVNACIAAPITQDETLTDASIRFHQSAGYSMAGMFEQCGYKFGRWYNMCWMEKHLGRHDVQPLPIRNFNEIRAAFAKRYGIDE